MANGFSFSSRTKLKAAATLVAAVALLVCLLDASGLLQAYHLKTLDMLFRLVPLPKASPQVVVVTVDQPDLDLFKDQGVTWPWPRQLYEHLIDFCRRGGAKAVIFDILFTEPSSRGVEDDQRLARAVAAAGNVVLPFFLSRDEKPPNPDEAALLAKARCAISGPAPAEPAAYRAVITPIAPLLQSAGALGNVESRPDEDGIFRRVPLVLPFKNQWLPTLPFAAFQHLAGGSLQFADGALLAGATRIPLDRQGRFLLKFRGPNRSHQRFSAANVIASEVRITHSQPPLYAPEAFAGKWVLVGLTAPGLLDLKACPVAAVYPGVEIHATLLDNLLQGDFLRPAPGPVTWAWLLLLAAAAILGVLFSRGLVFSLATLGALILVLLGATGWAFYLSWWADPVLPALALGLGFTLATSFSYATEGRQKLYIRRMFGQYMSETVISDLLEHPEKLRLGGERRRVTLFFSDLAGFTTISERLEPETVVGLLNDYLSSMTDIILEESGTVDKFEGDAIMALWGAPLEQPDQAARACRAALRQRAALDELNRRFAGMKLPPLKMRIGLNTGDAIVGNLGSAKRFDYTVIGDTVNLASRLEGLNKFYGTAIMASEATATECQEAVAFRELDLVAVKGKEKPVRVFEVVALQDELPPELAARDREFAQALAHYRGGDFAGAAQVLAALLQQFPEDGPSRTFLARCHQLEQAPPPEGWDTVFRPDGK